jgi:prepilin-type N-terminal cleavage/methylation domain-containing protein
MRRNLRNMRGFGLLEILVVIGIGALVIVLSYPGYKRTGLLKKAEQLKAELAVIEQAVQETSTKLKAPAGASFSLEQLKPQFKSITSGLLNGIDPLGHPYGPFRNDSKPKVPEKSAEQLQGVVPEGFWEPYPIAGEL